MSPWAKRRKFIVYLLLIALVLFIAISYSVKKFLKAPTCFDNKQNGEETGIDCGGACTSLCQGEFDSIKISWSKAIEISGNLYNIAALVENPNRKKNIEILYKFNVFSQEGNLIWTETGTTNLVPLENKVIFKAFNHLGKNKIKDVFFEIIENKATKHEKSANKKIIPTVKSKNYKIINGSPTLSTVLENKEALATKELKVIGILYDENKNIINFSRSIIDPIKSKDSKEVFMTWQTSFPKSVKTVDIFVHENDFNQ